MPSTFDQIKTPFDRLLIFLNTQVSESVFHQIRPILLSLGIVTEKDTKFSKFEFFLILFTLYILRSYGVEIPESSDMRDLIAFKDRINKIFSDVDALKEDIVAFTNSQVLGEMVPRSQGTEGMFGAKDADIEAMMREKSRQEGGLTQKEKDMRDKFTKFEA